MSIQPEELVDTPPNHSQMETIWIPVQLRFYMESLASKDLEIYYSSQYRSDLQCAQQCAHRLGKSGTWLLSGVYHSSALVEACGATRSSACWPVQSQAQTVFVVRRMTLSSCSYDVSK